MSATGPGPKIPDFELIRRIGGGSYGDVYIARSVTGIYRAVKIVDRARFEDDRPFFRELDGITKFQKNVGHQPNQLALLHVGRDESAGILYYVMELADDAQAGTDIDPATYSPLTLKELHARQPHLPVADTLRLGIDLARALVGLHETGLIHRDVKPSNIILVGGLPKLADIGLVSSLDRTLTALGTPGYAPPEGAGSIKADIYSLGKILYELSTGLSTDQFPRLPSDLALRADSKQLAELNEIILHACDPDPALRYPKAQTLLDDLLLLQAGKSVKQLYRLRSRVRTLGTGLAIAALIALVIGGIALLRDYQHTKQLAAQETTARQRAESDERLARYSSDLHIAQLALTNGNYGNCRTALRRQIPQKGEPDLRGPEWYILWNQTKGDQTRTYGNVGDTPIRLMALSPDEKFMAVQTNDDVTSLLNLETGEKKKLAENTRGLGGFTPDGTEVILGTADRKVRRVNITTGQLTPEQNTKGRLVAKADNNRTILLLEYENETGFRLIGWDAVAEKEIGVWHSGKYPTQLALTAMDMTDDGQQFAACVAWAEGTEWKRELLVYDCTKATVVARKPIIDQLYDIAFSADAKQLLIGESERPVKIFSAQTLEQQALLLYEGSRQKNELTLNQTGTRLAKSLSDHSIAISNFPNSAITRQLRGHEATLTISSWSKTSAILWSASLDGTLREWKSDSPPKITSVPMAQGQHLGDAIFSPDGTELAVSTPQNTLNLYSSEKLGIPEEIKEIFHPLGYSLDGKTLSGISKDKRLIKWNRDSKQCTFTALAAPADEQIHQAIATPTANEAALVLVSGKLICWDINKGIELFSTNAHTTDIQGLAISAEGQIIATGDRAGSVKIWHLRNGSLITELPNIVGGVLGLTISPEGNQIAVASYSNGSFQVWDIKSRVLLRTVDGHSATINGMTWLRKESRFISTSRDGSIGFWSDDFRYRLASYQFDAKLTLSPISGAVFSRQTKKAAIKFRDGQLQILSYE